MTVVKSVILSAAVVSTAVLLKLSLPATLHILTNDVPIFWSSFTHSWFRPPYLYILINCIILSIVASSKLHSPAVDTVVKEAEREFDFVVAAEAVKVELEAEEEVKEVVFGYAATRGDVVVAEREVVEADMSPQKVVPTVEAETEMVVVEERMPYSARFGHRKGVKGSPQGKTILKKVSRPKRQETLESTWRTLTEGRSMPLTRHLRKSDTLAAGAQQENGSPVHVMKKSDTFSYGGVVDSPSPGGKLRRESSLSQDDLNRRVEAFIKKFNEEMRLQQLQSVHQ